MTEDHTETDGESTDDTAASAPAGSESSDPVADTDDLRNGTTADSNTTADEPHPTNGDADDDEFQTDDRENGLQTDVPINIPQSDQSPDSSRDRSTAAADLDMDNVLDADDEDSEGLFDDLLSGEPIFDKKEVLRPSYTPG